MRIRALPAAIAFLVTLGAGTALAAEVSPVVPPAERTAPRVTPARGAPHAAFAVLFTLRETPGHRGILAVDYRVEISSPPGLAASCTVRQPPALTEGEDGTQARVELISPARGWCQGRYRATVYLERGPYCSPPRAARRAKVCPLFATREIDTGEAAFSVISKPPPQVGGN